MRIFVSYAYPDTIITRSLVHALRTAGADVWWAETPDDTMQLTHKSMAELKARPVFLAVLSPDALRSPAMQQSALIAVSHVHWRADHIALGVVARALEISPCESVDVLADFEREISRPDGAFKMPNLLLELPRISAPNGAPYPATELVHRTLMALALRPADATTEPAAGIPVDAGAREWLIYGRVRLVRGDYATAVSALEHASGLDPAYAPIWAYLGMGYVHTLQNTEANSAFDKAIELGLSRTSWIWANKAGALYGLNRYEDVLMAADKAISLNPTFAYAWDVKANALVGLERYDEALAAYKEVLRLKPEDSAASANILMLLTLQGRLDE